MKITINDIFAKFLLLLILIAGWGGSAWAARFEPTFEAGFSASSSNWYYLQFFNKGTSGYMYSQAGNAHFRHSGNNAQNPAYLWQLVGNKDTGFKLVSMTGMYGYWNNDFLTGTADEAQAATFRLVNGTDGDSWAIQKVNPSNGYPCLNPQGSNEIKSWNNDAGCRIRFYVAEAENLEIAKVVAFPDAIQYSPAPTASGWAFGTHWYKIANDRSKKFLAACEGYMDNNGYLKTRGSGEVAANTNQWCFVQDTNGKVTIYNKAAGPGMVLGSMTNQGSNDVRTKLYGKDEVVANISKLYTIGANGNGYYVRIEGLANGYWDDNTSSGYLASWQAAQAATSDGGRFFVTEVMPEGYLLSIHGDDNYTVTYEGVEYHDGNYLPISIDGLNLNNLTGFSINCTNKFVYGPVIDKGAKTVTYTVKDMVTSVNDFTTGFYQLQLFDDDSRKVSNVNSRINGSSGNINTKSNTIYVMPFQDVPTGGDQNLAKYSGVPTYAHEAATFFYIEKNGSNLQLQSVNGHYAVNDGRERPNAARNASPVTSGYAFPDGHLQFTGWVIQGLWSSSGCTGIEGPRVAYNGGTNYEKYNAAKADLSQYSIYKVVIEDAANASDIANDPNVTIAGGSDAEENNRGLNKVYRNGFLFFNRGYVPTAEDFTLHGTTYDSGFRINIGEEVNGIRTITFSAIPTALPFRVIITGDKKADEVITYHNHRRFKTAQTSMLLDGAPTSVRDGEEFMFRLGITEADLLDCDFSSHADSRTTGSSFIYGPVIDWENHTITCEIREAITGLPQTGWYQLKWDVSTDNNVAAANRYTNAREDNFTNYTRDANRFYVTMPKAGIPGRTEFMSYSVHPTAETTPLTLVKLVRSGNNVMLMSIDGRYLNEDATPSTSGSGYANAVTYVDGELDFRHWFPFNNYSYMVGKATNTHNYFYTTPAKFDHESYEFYEVHFHYEGMEGELVNGRSVTYTGPATNYSLNTVYSGGYLVFPSGTDIERSEITIHNTNASDIKNVTIDKASHRIAIELKLPKILHRQHAVFDHLHSAAEKPNSKFIQDGEGMIPHPYAANFTDADGYEDNDRTMQNTSVFHITQYAKKGGTTQVRMPYRRERDGSTQNGRYQRWYDYETERVLESGIVNLPGFAMYINGQVKTSGPLGMTNITLPTTRDEITVGVDASEFEDFSYDSNGNLIEPSLSMHVVIHVKDAAQMADALTTAGDTWWEEKTYIVPNIKRGTTAHKNNVDLLPLDMPFSNYWIYDDSHNLMRIVEEGGNYNNLANNLVVEVEGSAASYITADIFKNNGDTGIGDPPPVTTNHFIYYKVNGSELSRAVPAGSQAIIKVYARNGVSGTRYQLARFTLNFQAETEPLAITSVIGNEKSTRSVDYFLKNGMKEVANLTFQEKAANFTAIKGQGVQEGTYAFPLDPTRTSYSYSPNNAFAGYRITKKAYGMKTHPVSLYEQNIKSPEDAPALNTDPNDYYFYVDASEAPGQVASIPLDGNLCRGSKLYFYGWLASQNPCESSSTSASVILELIGRKGEQETILARYAPGVISDVAYNPEGGLVRSVQNGKTASEQGAYSYSYNLNGHGEDQNRIAAWQSIGFNYTLSEVGFDGFELRVLNNCFSTAGGDYSLDDFRVFVKTPQVNVDNAAPICGDELSIVRISTDFDALMDALQGGTGGEAITYYGTYAVLDKEIYDSHLASIDNPTTTDIAEAFNKAIMGETDKSKCYAGDTFLPELYAFHDIKFYSDYLSHDHITYSTLVGDNILETAGYMYQYNQNGDIIARNLVFNCKITDERIAGKQYYLVFHANLLPQDMADIDKADYASFFSMGDICCIRSEFKTMRAKMVKVEGSEELDPYNIDYCPGTSPTISLNSYGYDIRGELIQEHGVYYDWYMGTKEQFRKEYVWLDGHDIDIENIENYTHREILTAEDFCMEHCLMNFRYFYPNATAKELYDGTVRVHHFEKDDKTDTEYELTAKMIAKLKEWTSSGKLRLHLTAVSVDLSESDEHGMTHVLAIQQGAKLRYEHTDTEKENPILYCMDPVEISFRTKLEAPSASVGFADIDYDGTPYNRNKDKNVLYSLPLRINRTQIARMYEGSRLTLPLRVINPSGYYKVDGDNDELINTDKIHLEIDEDAKYVYVVETNDPQWSILSEAGGIEFMKPVGELKEIDADKVRTDGVINTLGIQFYSVTDSKGRRFEPNESYYYVLRAEFKEVLNEGVKQSSKYDVPEVQCKGNVLIPLKIVPEYIKWTGKESRDWNNDRNWVRADYDELHAGNQTSDGASPLVGYARNEMGSPVGGQTVTTGTYNGLPYDANDKKQTENDMDIYIPMDKAQYDGSIYANTFAYAPMADTKVIIPGNAQQFPVLARHTRDTQDGKTGLLLLADTETNTPYIIYDMVAVPSGGNITAGKYYDNHVDAVTFLPASAMANAHALDYNRAWVEYELDVNRWYTLASPLQNTFAGEWYAPTDGGRQQTPHFYGIEYSHELNHRFQPAIYQRSWDSEGNNPVYLKTGSKVENSYIQADWSHVYNDVKKEYSEGAFSVKVADDYMDNQPIGGKSLVRMPKADTKYTYYDSGNQTGDKADDAIAVTASRSRLWSDKLKDGDTFSQTIVNQTAGNNFFLVGNPFMSPMDMEAFFAANPGLEKKYWIISSDQQHVSVKAETGWISTTGEGSHVAPLQGFFVKAADADQTSLTVHYTAAMQGAADQKPLLRAPGRTRAAEAVNDVIRLTAERNGASSTALIVMDEAASDDFSEGEDCEAFIDGNLIDQPTVYTSAGAMAQTINVRRTLDMVPVGIISDDEDEAVLRFDLSQSRFETVILYDRELDTCTEVFDGTEVRMDGNSHGRYFISGTMQEDAIVKPIAETRRGVWTVSGMYCGEDVKGLQPGLYIVNGVKVTLR